MMKSLLIYLILISSALGYVPTVESLFRHGSNADISANGISITLSLKKVDSDGKIQFDENDFYKLFFTRTSEGIRLSQTRYTNASFSENSLIQKTYLPSYSSSSVPSNIESAEKGIFLGVIHAITHNNGIHLMNYLKNLGVPLRFNNELINREKIEFLASYKRYLAIISQDRNARKTEVNPMQPSDPAARERVQAIMAESMYTDTKQVRLMEEDGKVVWKVDAEPFEAVFSNTERDLLKLKYKSALGEYEIICRDYWRANGVHTLPRYVDIKTFSGQKYQVEIMGLRHFDDREEDLQKRLRNWDQILKNKQTSEPRPEFML